MPDYIPPTADWVREQVELYESSGGTKGITLRDTGLPCIIVKHVGNKTGAIRRIPLMRVEVEGCYVLIGSKGGSLENPGWVYNLRENKNVDIRDKSEVFKMRVREVTSNQERENLWKVAVKAYPPYDEYQLKTPRKIPVFIAEPV